MLSNIVFNGQKRFMIYPLVNIVIAFFQILERERERERERENVHQENNCRSGGKSSNVSFLLFISLFV